ncbi:MAG: helix-turn-helix domain-containing protein [Paraclostridium sp.]
MSKIGLGAKLRQMRAVKGLTMRQVSEATGITQQSISKYENDAINPGFDNVQTLCNLYGYKIMIVQKGAKVVK